MSVEITVIVIVAKILKMIVRMSKSENDNHSEIKSDSEIETDSV